METETCIRVLIKQHQGNLYCLYVTNESFPWTSKHRTPCSNCAFQRHETFQLSRVAKKLVIYSLDVMRYCLAYYQSLWINLRASAKCLNCKLYIALCGNWGNPLKTHAWCYNIWIFSGSVSFIYQGMEYHGILQYQYFSTPLLLLSICILLHYLKNR